MLKEEAVSPEMQLDRCKSYCRLNNEEYKVFQDLDFSGKDTKRPAFQAMQREISAGIIGKVIVYRLDRLSRSLKDLVLFIELLREKGVEFVSLTEKFDTSIPMGRAMLNIMGVFAQMEREVISQRIRDTKAMQIRDGMKLGMPPYGYILKVGKHGEWEICKEEAEIVKKVFSMYASGNFSYKSLALYLNGQKNRERLEKPGQSTWGNGEYSSYGWQPWTVRCILKNPTYAGIVREDISVDAKNFKPIISKKLFNQCSEIRNKRSAHHNSYCHSTTKDYPLKGKIFCSCGFLMYSTRGKDLPKELYYCCRNALKEKGHSRFAPADIVLEEILSYLMKCKVSSEILKMAKERLLKGKNVKETERVKMIKNLQESYQRLQERYIDGAVSKKFMERKAKEIKDKIKELQPKTSSYLKAELLSELPEIIKRLKQDESEIDKEYLKRLIELFVKRVVWNKDHIEKIEIYPELSDFFKKPYKPKEEVSAKELAFLTGLSIHKIWWWNDKGVLPHSKKLGREKRYEKSESMKRIKKIRILLKRGLRLWQIKEYIEKRRHFLSIREIAKRMGVSEWMIRYRLPFLMKPKIKRNKALYWDYKKAKEMLEGDLKPYRFLGKDLRKYRKNLGENKSPCLLPSKRKPKALIAALKKIGDKEEFIKGKPPLASAYEIEREFNVADGTIRYHIKKFVKPKIVTKRRKLYSREEVIETLKNAKEEVLNSLE